MIAAMGLEEPRVAAVLGELHQASKRDKWVFLRAAPAVLLARLKGVPIMTGINPYLGDAYIGVPPEVGRLLYLTARAIWTCNGLVPVT